LGQFLDFARDLAKGKAKALMDIGGDFAQFGPIGGAGSVLRDDLLELADELGEPLDGDRIVLDECDGLSAAGPRPKKWSTGCASRC